MRYEYITSSEFAEKSRDQVPLRGIWDGLKENTSAHGIPHVEIARGRFKKVVWTIISVGVFCMMILHLYDIFSKFFSRPVSVSLKLLPSRELPFPAVTVCNTNPLKRSALESGNPVLASLLLNQEEERKRRRKRAAGCSAGWDDFQGVCYYFSDDQLNHADSKAACEAKGAVLADLASQAENDYVQTTIGTRRYYFGLVKVGTDWVWLSGSTSPYRNWKSDEPNNSGPCGTIQAGSDKWRDIWCSGVYYYLCQIRPAVTTEGPTTDPPTTDPPTTDPPTTDPPTTDPPTTDPPTTIPPTTIPPTTIPPTTIPPTTIPPTTIPPTTIPPTTIPPTTIPPTTIPPTTISPTTIPPTTIPPTTIFPTTEFPTTDPPTTMSPTTIPATTDPPTTVAITTVPATTNPPTTNQETTISPTTARTTIPPTTVYPTTDLLTTTATSATTTTTSAATTTTSSATTTSSPTTTTTALPPTTTIATTTAATTALPTTTTTTATTTTTTGLPPTTTPSPGATAPPPQSIPGSIYPERIQVRQEFQNEEKAIEVLADMPEEEKSVLGYSADEFILDCQYFGYYCNPKEFFKFYNGIHGNCFIFNSGWNTSNPIEPSERTGRRYGLKLVINIDQAEYTDRFGEEAGARVVVHSQDKMPFPEDEGVLAKPGMLTSIGVRKVSVTRLPHPYGDCVDTEREEVNLTRNVFEEIYPTKYSTSGCFKTCYQYYVISECGCADAYYPKEGAAFPDVTHSCDPNNIIEDDCKYNVTRRYMSNQLDCNCPRSCHDQFYVPEVSAARWPADVQEGFVKSAFSSTIPQIINDPNNTQRFRRDLLKIEVYYEELNYEQVSERSSYGVFQFLSDIGGTLGLWLGFSLMTTFEFLEFGVDLLVYGCLRLSGRGAGTGLSDSPRRAPLHRRNRRRATLAAVNATGDQGTPASTRPLTRNDIELEDIEDYDRDEPGGSAGDYPISPPPPYSSRNITPVD